MSLRSRVTLAAGAAVLLVVVAASTAVYLLVRQDLRNQVDESLRDRTQMTVRMPRAVFEGDPADRATAADRRVVALISDFQVQLIDADGEILPAVVNHTPGGPLPVTDKAVEVARGEHLDAFYDTAVAGEPMRVYTRQTPEGAVQFGRSLADTEETLDQLVAWLTLISVVAIILALALGALVAATAVSPVHRLSRAARTVARTGDLSHHIPVSGRDELAELAESFNTMLDALDGSLAKQRQLVADASHELRTPLASVRTNVEVLQRAGDMDPRERQQLMRDIVAQIAEVTRLLEDLVELARGDTDEEPRQSVVLDDLVAEVVDRARVNHPSVVFVLRTEEAVTTVDAAPQRLARAVNNLVDNAAKWSPPDGTVTVDVSGPTVSVTDSGPGIDSDDLPFIFDRFYRSASARGMPGSGLGLSIVKQVADSHAGTVTVENRDGGGAHFTLSLPAA